MRRRLIACFTAGTLIWACARAGTPTNEQGLPDPELARLYEQDQSARSGPIDQVDMSVLGRQDSIRRELVRAREHAGALRTALDYRNAAMIFQHGRDSTDYAVAHQWAVRSEALDSTDAATRWLVAATWDRYQMSRNQPQWYGTQTDRVPRGTGPMVLYTIDTTRVTDAKRRWRGVGTLAELRARLDTMNAHRGLR